MRVLVTGGVRSGKSAHAESLLADAESVTYLATSLVPDGDAEWASRVAAHRARRPGTWHTVETLDLARALGEAGPAGGVMVDSLGTWVAGCVDALGWDGDREAIRHSLLEDLETALTRLPARAVLVTDEVGLGGIATEASARLFADLLGEVNQRAARVCDEVHLVVAGRVLVL